MGLPLRKVGEYRENAAALRGATLKAAATRYSTLKLAARRWRPSTAQTFRHALARVESVIGDKPVREISSEDVERTWLTLAGQFSPQWVRRIRESLGGLLRWLHRHQAIDRDPMGIWEASRIGEDEHVRVFHEFTASELQQLLAPSRPVIWKTCWTAVYTGLRRANLCGMKWGWISGDWILEIPEAEFKQGRKHRIPLHPALHGILEPRRGPGDLVFEGLPCPARFTRHLRELAYRTGINPDWAHPHNLRRTFCARLKAAGVSRQKAMDLLGSRSETVLIRHYWPKTEDQELRESIEKI